MERRVEKWVWNLVWLRHVGERGRRVRREEERDKERRGLGAGRKRGEGRTI